MLALGFGVADFDRLGAAAFGVSTFDFFWSAAGPFAGVFALIVENISATFILSRDFSFVAFGVPLGDLAFFGDLDGVFNMILGVPFLSGDLTFVETTFGVLGFGEAGIGETIAVGFEVFVFGEASFAGVPSDEDGGLLFGEMILEGFFADFGVCVLFSFDAEAYNKQRHLHK